MLIWLFIRGYKVYRKSTFIPIYHPNFWSNFSAFVGDNGAWKSSVLEALDTFFNNQNRWSINDYTQKNAYLDQVVVSPIFLFEKGILNSEFNTEEEKDELIKITKILSEEKNSKPYLNRFREFIKWIDLNKNYLVTTPLFYDKSGSSWFPKKLSEHENIIDELKEFVYRNYNYIYIPVEIPVQEVVNFQSEKIQHLIDKDIINEIDWLLKTKVEISTQNNRTAKKSIIDLIDKSFEMMIKNVEDRLKLTWVNYEYKSVDEWQTRQRTKKIRPSDLRENILDIYFYQRRIHKDNKQLQELSSGEQRIALLEIISNLLSNWEKKAKYNIIWIDEPEASMHSKRILDQFEKINELAKFNQCLITTHWYWRLPTFSYWWFHYLDKNEELSEIKVSSFEIFNYLEKYWSFPKDIELKSFFDLASSIILSMKNWYSWIICEWSDDKLYIQKHFWDNNVCVLSVWWSGNVKKIFNYIISTVWDESYTWNILCLVDTDPKIDLIINSWKEINQVIYRRIQRLPSWKIDLLTSNESKSYHEKTDMENTLNPLMFYVAIENRLSLLNDESLITAWKEFEFNSWVTFAEIEWDDSILKPIVIDFQKSKRILVKKINSLSAKYWIAKEYVSLDEENFKYDYQWAEFWKKISDIFDTSET